MNQEDLEKIKQELNLGNVLYLPSTTSTNDVAKNLLAIGVPHFSVIVADSQTKGRGRNDRKWYTPPNSGLAVSIIFTNPLTPEHFLRYSGLAALAVSDTLSIFTDAKIQIKWPNDILIDQLKVGGVLVEAQWSGSLIQGLIMGAGINISKNSVPPVKNLHFPATCLENHTSLKIDRTEFLKAFLERVIFWHHQITTPKFIQEWENRLAFKGELVQLISTELTITEGRLKGLSDLGEAILMLEDGSEKHYNANELRLRPSKNQ